MTLGLLWLLWAVADGPQAARSLAAADWRWLLLAMAALTAQTILSAFRWRLTARQLGISIGRGRAIGEYYLSQIVNQSLPGGILGDAGRAVRSRDQAGLLAAGQAVIFERLAGQIAMFSLLAVAFVATLAVPGGLDWPPDIAVSVAILLAAAVCAAGFAGLAGHLPGALGRGMRSLRSALHQALAARTALPGQIGLSIGTTVCNLAAFAFCARAVGVDLGLAATAALVPLILLAMLIPVTISGWGLREGAAAALLPIAGATVAGALAASVAFGLTILAALVPGVLVLWIGPQAKRRATVQFEAGAQDGTRQRARAGCI